MPVANLLKSVAAAATLVGLVSCGGGNATGSTTTPPPPPPVTTLTGKMIDDPVQGLHYGTTMDPATSFPKDFSRVTGPNGEYTYNTGEAVMFRIGRLNVGGFQPATGIVTPSRMAANQTQLQNILILLQSLDQDGNPFNGIVIPQGADDYFANPNIDINPATLWSLSPDVFASSANTLLVGARNQAGITTPIINPAQASANFLRQFLQLFAIKVWSEADATEFTLVRGDTTGRYLMGQASPSDATGHAGVEVGRITAAGFDRFGWVWSAPTLTTDTNGEWGLSHLQSCERVNIIGEALSANDCNGNGNALLVYMENAPTGIVGAWALGSATNTQVLTLAFFSNGKFGVVDPTGSTATPSCGGPGVEFGSYSYDAATRILKVSNLLYDTDGCAGLSGTAAATATGLTFTLGSGATTATYNDGTARTLYRVSQ